MLAAMAMFMATTAIGTTLARIARFDTRAPEIGDIRPVPGLWGCAKIRRMIISLWAESIYPTGFCPTGWSFPTHGNRFGLHE